MGQQQPDVLPLLSRPARRNRRLRRRLLAGADEGPEAINKELAKLGGEWSMVSGEIDTQSLPEAYVKGSRRMVKEDDLTVIISGKGPL